MDLQAPDGFVLPISPSDAAAMFKQPIKKNMKPYHEEVVRCNNRKVREWELNVLNNSTDSKGTLQTGRVYDSWQLYDEGTNVIQFNTLCEDGMIPEINNEIINFWVDLFENSSIETLYEMGSGVVSLGWTIVKMYIQTWCAQKKYDDLFSQSTDPVFWERNRFSHIDLIKGKVLPIWTTAQMLDISKKIAAVLLVQPHKFLENTSTPKNTPPYHAEVIRLNNQRLKKWRRDVYNKLDSPPTDPKEVYRCWALYDEGIQSSKFKELSDNGFIWVASSEVVGSWSSLFVEQSITDLHKLGVGAVNYGWTIIRLFIQTWCTNEKINELFEVYDDPLQWQLHAHEHEKLLGGAIIPLWDTPTAIDVSEKVGAITTNVVEVQGVVM